MTRDPSDTDVLIVGSGASAVNAAWPLAQAGLRVRMLDFGNRDDVYGPLVPAGSFAQIRRTDPEQHRYLLGERFEGIAFGHTGAGAQLTPPRQYVCRDTAERTPVESADFLPLESLAEGGLAGAWGAGAPPFADPDLADLPLDRRALEPHYEAVAARIGVSGARDDDLLPFFGDLATLQPPLALDSNGESILERYRRRRDRLNGKGFHLGRPRLAALSQPHRGREAHGYGDMDFWSDRGRSVWRPQWTLDELRALPNFDYRGDLLVERFAEAGETAVRVTARRRVTGEPEQHRGRKLILAAGTLGTARIVLRSLGHYERRVPLVCNPHSYAALVNLNLLGARVRDARHSLAQLCCVLAPAGAGQPTTVGHLYSYRSLMLFRLAKDSPLPLRESLRILRLLLPSLAILIVQHADRPSPDKSCTLVPGNGGEPDRLRIDYRRSPEERRQTDRTERAILAGFRRLGCLCLGIVRPGHAASVHYAGTLPMTRESRELTCDMEARLRGTRSVHLADGSLLGSLPSRGHTFTMMALADRTGGIVRDLLRA